MDRLRTIETFIKVADLGSFYKAAIIQGVTPQAVSKAIRQLESELGIRLFHRSKRSTSLTEDGAHFLQEVRSGVAAVSAAWDHVQQATAADTGLVRLTAPVSASRRILIPLIQAFRAEHPGIEFDILAEDRYTDIVAAGIDVGFRCGFAPEGQWVVRELFRIQMIPCASPDYLMRHGVPDTRAMLANHACTAARHANTGRITPWEFQDGDDVVFENIRPAFCSNDAETELEAVLAGMGVGLIDSIIASPHLRSGRLVPVLCDSASERYGVFLYHAPRLDMPRRVRQFIDFSLAALRSSKEYRVEGEEMGGLLEGFAARMAVAIP
jgi:DNA-binding transcriptional LysR family regulator